MYTISDYTKFNAEMNHFVSTLEFDRGRVHWTGFKIADDAESTDLPRSPDEGAVAQWCGMNTEMTNHFYVNIPGMQSGEHKKGESFDIGVTRVFPGQDAQTIYETKALIRQGLGKLKSMIEAEGQ